MVLSKENKVIVKEIIETNRKLQKLQIWQDKVDFIEAILNNLAKFLIFIGLIASYFKGDIMLMLLFIGVAIVTLGIWNKIE